MMQQDAPVILFDGICNLCAASVQFVLRNERSPIYRFASLQSDVGREYLAKIVPAEYQNTNTIILIEGGVAYYKSTAALKIARSLSFPWPILSIFLIMPEKIRDLAYDFIGQRRYKWFGKMDACWVPDQSVSDRFLDRK
jgi:predicted DCC family thiol-disulfide oxidoreductase YuxK